MDNIAHLHKSPIYSIHSQVSNHATKSVLWQCTSNYEDKKVEQTIGLLTVCGLGGNLAGSGSSTAKSTPPRGAPNAVATPAAAPTQASLMRMSRPFAYPSCTVRDQIRRKIHIMEMFISTASSSLQIAGKQVDKVP